MKVKEAEKKMLMQKCKYFKDCGGCSLWNLNYNEQLKKKQKYMENLLKNFGKPKQIIGMKNPLFYRNKVHHGFTKDRSGNIISGPYEKGSHWIINADTCLIEDEICQKIAKSVAIVSKKMRVPIYNEKTGHGVMRRVLVRRGFKTNEIMVVLVVGDRKFIKKREFAKELLKIHPEITTIISNLNDKRTSMILGDKEEVLYGEGFIRDEILGCTFRISSKSFYQVNPVQTEILYQTAIDFADLKGKETIIDAYSGIGTIGQIAASKAKRLIGIELNPDAVKDARENAKENKIENSKYICADAGKIMVEMAQRGEKADVVFLDPPRSGCTISFMKAVVKINPEKIVYVSCGPESLKINLEFFKEQGYEIKEIQPVDMFPFTEHVESVSLLVKV